MVTSETHCIACALDLTYPSKEGKGLGYGIFYTLGHWLMAASPVMLIFPLLVFHSVGQSRLQQTQTVFRQRNVETGIWEEAKWPLNDKH